MSKSGFLRRVGRLFVIKTRFEAYAVTYAIAMGAVDRGSHYLERFPGVIGWIFFALCTGVVFMVGAKLLDITRPDTGDRRRRSDQEDAPRRRREDLIPSR